MDFIDAIELDVPGARLTRDGYLVTSARAARTGIQNYAGVEMGRPDMEVVRVYRPETEVFKEDALKSFSSMPVTLEHPPEMVDASNWSRYARGYSGEDVIRDGNFVRVPLILKDSAAVQAVRDGKRQLSFGYTCDVEFSPGKTPDGEDYDAIQKNLRGNHLALVSKARAGSACRVGDGTSFLHGEQAMPDNLKTVVVDGFSVQTTDAGAQAIDTLTKRVSEHATANMKLVADHALEVRAKDGEIERLKTELSARDKALGERDGEITKLRGETMDASRIDALVAERQEIMDKAALVVGDVSGFKGKSIPDIRRAVVEKIQGVDSIKGMSDDYVWALFNKNAEDAARSDPVARVITGDSSRPASTSFRNPQAVRDQAYLDSVKELENAWKTPANTMKGAA